MKYLMYAAVLLSATMSNAQYVFEKEVYKSPSGQNGPMELHDNVLSNYKDTSDLVSTGFYLNSEEADSALYRIVLTSHDSLGAKNFAHDYTVYDSDEKLLDSYSYSVAETTSGYIMVGKVASNSHYGSSATNGGDIILVRTNASGTVLASKRVDIGGDETAYAIKETGNNTDTYLVCGTSLKSDGSSQAFVMEIDNTLAINWMTQMDLRITSTNTTTAILYDVTTDGSNVWSVGSIKDGGTANDDALVVKLSTTGTYLTSRKLHNGNEKETFYHVEMDGSNLIITGNSKNRFLNIKSRMIALKYTTSSHTVSKCLWLKSGHGQDIGYDIMKATISGTTNYYVVGVAIPASGSTKGVFYKLDNNFQAVRHEQYSGPGNTSLRAIDIYDQVHANAFLGMAGYRTPSSAPKRGYVLKSDLNGVTGCADSTRIDTLAITFTIDTLLYDIDENYSTDTAVVLRYTLVDTLICSDTLAGLMAMNYMKSMEHDAKPIQLGKVYPNPVKQHGTLKVALPEGSRAEQMVLFDHMGRVVTAEYNMSERLSEIELNTVQPGLYIVKFTYLNEHDVRMTESVNVVVE